MTAGKRALVASALLLLVLWLLGPALHDIFVHGGEHDSSADEHNAFCSLFHGLSQAVAEGLSVMLPFDGGTAPVQVLPLPPVHAQAPNLQPARAPPAIA